MIKILLRPELFNERVLDNNISTACHTSGITYPTYHKMVRGTWSPLAMKTLALYFESLGMTAEELRSTPVGDLFIVTDDGK